MLKKKDKKNLDREIRSALLEDVEWLTTVVAAQWKKIVIGAVVIIVAVGVFYSISLESKRRERRAADALASAGTIEQLVQAIDKYPGYATSNFARLRLARLYVEKKDFDAAKKQFAAVAENGADAATLDRMRLDEVYMQELSGDKSGAAGAFLQLAPGLTTNALRCEAYYCAGRLYIDCGNNSAAAEALTLAVGAAQDSEAQMFASLANSLLCSLGGAAAK